eukprot:CAMPEP_0202886896 /NCGR_PEP_ID=MMETSP1391-20130828/42406_1 /ASSEMBLY_ACC=CAM_ASM_000867 /TAXON_ID=1034604 /ORGANISM="Chlamydomonas leiostraca, Strain SAG 11-49" /LENGTH=49 /DNA_ID=CAMNT_0049570171 /DNA_START=59 /DNA_END=208 /DNA_ORIENTATION=-
MEAGTSLVGPAQQAQHGRVSSPSTQELFQHAKVVQHAVQGGGSVEGEVV